MVMDVDSETLVVSEGEMVSSGSSVMSPASRTDLTSVNFVPSTTRDLPLIVTVTMAVPALRPLMGCRSYPRDTSSPLLSVAEYAVTRDFEDCSCA